MANSKTNAAGSVVLPLFAYAVRQLGPPAERQRGAAPERRIATGMAALDVALSGGLPQGGATLVAARPNATSNAWCMSTALAILERGARVALFSERFAEAQLRGHLAVIRAGVNRYRFRAGLVTADDRVALAAARARIPWSQLSIRAGEWLDLDDVESSIATYRPDVAFVDLRLRAHAAKQRRRFDAMTRIVDRLTRLARRRRTALVVRMLLPELGDIPRVSEVAGGARLAGLFDTLLVLHRPTPGEPHTPDASVTHAYLPAASEYARARAAVPLHFDGRTESVTDAATPRA